MIIHGDTETPLYEVWCGMKARCLNVNHKSYKWYGGRGITVCDEWKTNFVVFRDWAKANGYERGLQLDRINGNDSYRPGNCRFVTASINNRNRINGRLLTIGNETKCVSDWGEDSRCAVNLGTFQGRIRAGMDPEQAFTQPPAPNGGLRLTAWGETKTAREWGRDTRCSITRQSLLSRLDHGWHPEDAISYPPRASKPR